MNDVVLHGPLGRLAKRIAEKGGVDEFSAYAVLLSLWSASISRSVSMLSRGFLRPPLVWMALVAKSDDTAHEIFERVTAPLNEHDGSPLQSVILQNATTKAQFDTTVRRAVPQGRKDPNGTRNVVLIGSPFQTRGSNSSSLQDHLQYAFRGAWDKGRQTSVSIAKNKLGSAEMPHIGLLWSIGEDAWNEGFNALPAATKSRIMSVTGDTLPSPTKSDTEILPQDLVEISHAHRWAVARSRILDFTPAAKELLGKIYSSVDGLGTENPGRSQWLDGPEGHFLRAFEHTLRTAASLAAADLSTLIGVVHAKAAWSFTRRSMLDTADLLTAVNGRTPVTTFILAEIADIDAVIAQLDLADEPLPDYGDEPVEPDRVDAEGGPVARREAVVQRQLRDSVIVRKVKNWYRNQCQICRFAIRVPGPAEGYSEGAHIRALGIAHKGADSLDNLLCLCPNCHKRFDLGSIYLTDELRIIDFFTGESLGDLFLVSGHQIDLENVRYHRRHFAID
ncbi:HNH endonuclease [Actinomadura sp. SCN-SB]|uniref:HNH endonuclease n=1 Tax=Actinomadura sp. SCN-SB TaxID=3373092 RepID=UPI003752BE29